VPSTRLEGSVCLVTGATSGIGRATAIRLAAHGTRLLLSGRDVGALAELEATTGGSPVALDLSEPGAGRELARRALEVFDRVDVVVNSAGSGLYGPAAELVQDDLERIVRVNLLAPIELTSALLPGMLERRSGHVVLIGSIAGRLGRANEATYAASKAALAVFADSLGLELAGSGVAVSLVTPGVVDTPFFERRGAPYDRAWPRPLPADRVAARVVDAIFSSRAEVTVPAWLGLVARFRGALPGVYAALARRFD
jgi:short-subunit dehydrogenase